MRVFTAIQIIDREMYPVLQDTFVTGLGGDIVLDNDDFARYGTYHHDCLKTHPLYPVLQQCLMKHSSDRPNAAALKEQMYDRVSLSFNTWVCLVSQSY